METGSAQGEGGLYLLPAKTKVIPFQLVPQPEDVGKLLQVKKILKYFAIRVFALINNLFV